MSRARRLVVVPAGHCDVSVLDGHGDFGHYVHLEGTLRALYRHAPSVDLYFNALRKSDGFASYP